MPPVRPVEMQMRYPHLLSAASRSNPVGQYKHYTVVIRCSYELLVCTGMNQGSWSCCPAHQHERSGVDKVRHVEISWRCEGITNIAETSTRLHLSRADHFLGTIDQPDKGETIKRETLALTDCSVFDSSRSCLVLRSELPRVPKAPGTIVSSRDRNRTANHQRYRHCRAKAVVLQCADRLELCVELPYRGVLGPPAWWESDAEIRSWRLLSNP